MGRTLTEALHGVRAEDLAGSLGPEVVTSNIFTVASAEHQLIPVFLLLRFQSLMSDSPPSSLVYAASVCPTLGSGASGMLGAMPCWASPRLHHSQDS